MPKRHFCISDLKYSLLTSATNDTNVQLMVPMSSRKCCSAIWISVICGMIWIVWKDIVFWTRNFDFKNHKFLLNFTSKNRPESSSEVQLLADTKYRFYSFWECQRDRLFPHISFQFDALHKYLSANQKGASIWKPCLVIFWCFVYCSIFVLLIST